MSFAEKLEGNAAHTHGPYHGSDFDGRFILGEGNLQIKNIVDPNVGLALDDAPTQGEVQHHALAPHLPSGKRQAQPNRDPEMFPALNRVRGSRRARATGEETMATVLALEWSDPNERRNQFARGLRSPLQYIVLVTPWAGHPATHATCLSLISNSTTSL
ncbi:hypothetical protein COMA2_70055 [Candidatus Nitrospira nitrificans]|uniref:Uncharacterized protein n=1 Tax=Candidatus Nitrospira nitrificans TaxID=1742973 RepID=A0A0S4LTB7_9BACT|nr:hypothetical protein COMA2_70055 [Candidatus Nitrospira nitrificans]